MEDVEEGNGDEIFYGDVVTLYDEQAGGFLCADGFGSTTIMYKRVEEPPPSAMFRITTKLTYVQQKMYNSILSEIGVHERDEIEKFKEEEDVDPAEERKLDRLEEPRAKEQNENLVEIERQRGTSLVYGKCIQLKHCASDKYVTLVEGTSGLQPGSMRVEVDSEGSEGSWIDVQPGFKVRKEQEPVLITDQVVLRFTVSLSYVHSFVPRATDSEKSDEIPEDMNPRGEKMHGEVNAVEGLAGDGRFTVRRYARHDQGNSIMCSGDAVRIMHKQEQAYLCFGEAGNGDDKKNRLHLFSRDREPIAMTCSNALWHFVQLDVTNEHELNARRKSGRNSKPRERGGNCSWNYLYRLKHKGMNRYLAASFDATGGRTVRLYLATPEELEHDEFILETLWNVRPVNPKSDDDQWIGMDEKFHLRHVSTRSWLHAQDRVVHTDAGQPEPELLTAGGPYRHAIKSEFWDTDVEIGPPHQVIRGRKAARKVEMVPGRPYSDAFGLDVDAKTHNEHVMDVNKILDELPYFWRYVDQTLPQRLRATSNEGDVSLVERQLLEAERGLEPEPENALDTTARTDGGSGHTPLVKITDANKLCALMERLILKFVTEDKKNQDPLTRMGSIHSPARQQLLRDQGMLEVLVRMCTDPVERHSLDYETLEKLEPSVFKVCQLANRLTMHILRDNSHNRMYMLHHNLIRLYKDQIGRNLFSSDILNTLHKDNHPLLTEMKEATFQAYVKMMVDAITSGKFVGRLWRATHFLSITCVCHGVEVRANQDFIAKYLIKDEESARIAMCNFDGVDSNVRVIALGMEPILLEDLFASKDPVKVEIQNFAIYSVSLYANLCLGRNMSVIQVLQSKFSEKMILGIIKDEDNRFKGCEMLRAQFCQLFVRLYIDTGGRSKQSPIALTRVWDDVSKDKVLLKDEKDPRNPYVRRLTMDDEEPFDDLKTWIVQKFLQQQACKEMEASSDPTKMACNAFVVSVLELIYAMIEFGCYVYAEKLEEVLRPLLVVLRGETDKCADKEEEANPTWRFKYRPENRPLTAAKTVICRCFDRAADLRLNLRISHMLVAFRDQLDRKSGPEEYILGDRTRTPRVSPGMYFQGVHGWAAGKSLALRPSLGTIFGQRRGGGVGLDFQELCPGASTTDVHAPTRQDPFGTRPVPVQALDFTNALLDLTQYEGAENAELVSAAFNVLIKTYRQRYDMAQVLANVQLLCSKPQKEFFEKGLQYKHGLDLYLASDRQFAQQELCIGVIKQMMSSISVGFRELTLTVDPKIREGRQELYKNIDVPSTLLKIVRDCRFLDGYKRSTPQSTTTADLLLCTCYEYLVSLARGSDAIKELLNKHGFETFLAHLDGEFGADKLITELYTDNRKLCTQVTALQIKQFVNLILEHGASPRWLGFMSSLVVVKGSEIKRNQTTVIREMVQNKTMTMNDKHMYITAESWELAKERMANDDHLVYPPPDGGLEYHVTLVNLLGKCAQGMNASAELMCQQEMPKAVLVRGLRDPATIPYVKSAYLHFLFETFIEVDQNKGVMRKMEYDVEVWDALARICTELEESRSIQNGQAPEGWHRKGQNGELVDRPWTERNMKEQVQYLFKDVVSFLTGWFQTHYKPFEKLTPSLNGGAVFGGTLLWDLLPCPKEERERIEAIATRLLDGLCFLYDPHHQPKAECEILSADKEQLQICIMIMMDAGVRPTNDKQRDLPQNWVRQAKLHYDKGVEKSRNFDKFAESDNPPANEALTQLGLTMFSRGFLQVAVPDEEAAALVGVMRRLVSLDSKGDAAGDDRLVPYGDVDSAYSDIWTYLRVFIFEIEKDTCSNTNRVELVKYLSRMVSFPFAGTVLVRKRDASVMRTNMVSESNLGVVSLVIRLISTDGMSTPLFKNALDVAISLLIVDIDKKDSREEKSAKRELMALVQKTFLRVLNHVGVGARCVPFFQQLLKRIMDSRTECKAQKNFYLQQESTRQELLRLEAQEAAEITQGKRFLNATFLKAKEIQEKTRAPDEKFDEHGHIYRVLLLMQLLTEDNNQEFKAFWATQPNSSSQFNLVQQIASFTDVLNKSIEHYNVHTGVQLFDTLTEVIIGPCQQNQNMLEKELKMETLNQILKLEAERPGKVPIDIVQLRELKQACIGLMQAMLEGEKKYDDKVLKKFQDLEKDYLIGEVISTFQANVQSQSRLVAFYQFMNRRLPFLMRPAMKEALKCQIDIEGRMELAFGYIALLLQMHDTAQECPQKPLPFLSSLDVILGKDDEWKNAKDNIRKKLDIKIANKTASLRYFLKRTGRIEIKRENPDRSARIERCYFRIPEYCCDTLSELSKDTLKNEIVRTSDKLKMFIGHWTEDLKAEVKLQEALSKITIYRLLNSKREFLKAVSYNLAFMINFIMIAGIDHEDKYDADVSSNFDPGGATPYRIFDLYSVPVQDWGTIDLYGGGKAYIPLKMKQSILYLGLAQTCISGINFMLFVVGRGPLIIRQRWKQLHTESEDEIKRGDSNYIKKSFEYETVYTGWKLPLFLVRSLFFILLNGSVLYQVIYIGCTVLGNVYSEFFFVFHLTDILNRDNELQSVLDAIALPIARIMKTLWLAGVFMYAFTVIGFIFFHDHFLDAERANYKDENNCNSVLQCLLFTLYSGLISSETWAAASLTDLWPLHRYSAAHDQEVEFVPIVVARYFYDLLFFIIIGVVLIGGVLFGIILDKFFEIRQNKAEVIEDQQKKCFICGVESEVFDRSGAGFDNHIKDDHNMWQYVYYMIYLDEKPSDQLNGPEAFVAGKSLGLAEPNAQDFLPSTALVLASDADAEAPEGDDMVLKMRGMQQELTTLKRNYGRSVKTVGELLGTVKLLEQKLSGVGGG